MFKEDLKKHTIVYLFTYLKDLELKLIIINKFTLLLTLLGYS